MDIKRILVPTDFSKDAEVALAYAVALARPFNASLHVLHVVENPLAAGMWSSEIYTAEIAGLQINLGTRCRRTGSGNSLRRSRRHRSASLARFDREGRPRQLPRSHASGS